MPERTLTKIKNRFFALLKLPRNRPYLISCLILIFAAILLGLENPTGIIAGWLAAIVFFVALARRWWTPWYFLIVAVGSFLGAIVISFIYMDVAMPVAKWIGGANVADSTAWRVFHMVVSNLILLVVPMGIFFGTVGFFICSGYYLFRLIKRRYFTRGT